MTDTTRLRELAAAATPGPWGWARQGLTDGYPNVIVNAAESGYPGALLWGIRAEDDADYIAALSPDVTTALLDELDALRKVAEAAREEGCEASRWADEDPPVPDRCLDDDYVGGDYEYVAGAPPPPALVRCVPCMARAALDALEARRDPE